LLDGRKRAYGDAGVATFQHEVDFIHATPFLLLVEVCGLWLPIAFHSILGVYYATTGKSNVQRYGYQDNWRYALQRITGYVGVLFIFWHVATLRWGWTMLLPYNWGLPKGIDPMQWEGEHAASSMAAIMQQGYEGMTTWGLLVTFVYALSVAALVFHFANGLWTAAITWGLTISENAQRRWGRVCFAIGVGLMVLGLGSAFRFATMDYTKARETELKLHASRGMETSSAGDVPGTLRGLTSRGSGASR
jgi:succinate dehydrogenase / fumarate reductase cytochrome b subunit